VIETASYFGVAYMAFRGLIAIIEEDDPIITALFAVANAVMCCGVMIVARFI
jgi:hypothetical protein